jgi:thiol-disulfide isomerase/thioredoxin
MKRTILSTASIVSALLCAAQAQNYPDGSTVADFTVTDTEGNSHSLYEITAQGKHVMLDFFFVDCPPCQATQTYYNQLHETYGCNGHDLYVISINRGIDSDAQVVAYEAQYGGSYTHSPAVSMEGGGGTVNSAFGVFAWPTYVLIGPDNIMKNNDIWPISNMNTFVQAFPAGSNIDPAACLVGIGENGASYQTRVYPSPSSGVVSIEIDGDVDGSLQVKVIDALGRSVHSTNLAASINIATLDLSALQNGNYMIQLVQADRVLTVNKLVIAR